MGKHRLFGALLLHYCSALLHYSAHAQSLKLFWYTNGTDLVQSRIPDMQYKMGGDPYGTMDPPINDTERKEAENALNIIRSSAVPPGSDINKVTWDTKSENALRESAKKCDGGTGKSILGEIMVGSTTQLSYKDALFILKAQGVNYSYQTNNCSTALCTQYVKLMSGSSTNFVCTRVHCPDTAMPYQVYCSLPRLPGYNELKEKPYTKGTPCQLCPRARGYCYNNLCVSYHERAQIKRENPDAVVTCSAPCLNCGVRKEFDRITEKACECDCPAGFQSAEDCSVPDSGADPKSLTCGPCQRQGTPCQNNGMEPIDSTTCTSCLCPREFMGRLCDVPTNGYTGGVRVPFEDKKVCDESGCHITPVDISILPKIFPNIKEKIASGINSFCKESQSNYGQCCGSGTLPTIGALDFVKESDVKTFEQMEFDATGRLTASIYVDTQGNNGLCRKTTELPPPKVAIPSEVLAKVITNRLPNLKISSSSTIPTAPTGTVKDHLGKGEGGGGFRFRKEISTLMVTI